MQHIHALPRLLHQQAARGTLAAHAMRSAARIPTAAALRMRPAASAPSSLLLSSRSFASTAQAASSGSSSSRGDSLLDDLLQQWRRNPAMGAYLVLGGGAVMGSLAYMLWFNQPLDHEVAQQASIVVERHAGQMRQAVAQWKQQQQQAQTTTGSAAPAATAAPSTDGAKGAEGPPTLRFGRVFDSVFPFSGDKCELYVLVKDTELGDGQMHIHAKRKNVTREGEQAPGDAMAAAPASAAAAASTSASADSSIPAEPEILPLEWDLTSLSVIFPSSNAAFRYDFASGQFVASLGSGAANDAKRVFSVARGLRNLAASSSSPDSWWQGPLMAVFLGLSALAAWQWSKGKPDRRLHAAIKRALESNPELKRAMGLDSAAALHATRGKASFGLRTPPRRPGQIGEIAPVKDKSLVSHAYTVRAPGKKGRRGTATVDTMSVSQAGGSTKWRVGGVKFRLDGSSGNVSIRGVKPFPQDP